MQDTNTFSLELYLVGRSLIDRDHNKDTSFSNVLIAMQISSSTNEFYISHYLSVTQIFNFITALCILERCSVMQNAVDPPIVFLSPLLLQTFF